MIVNQPIDGMDERAESHIEYGMSRYNDNEDLPIVNEWQA